MSKYFFIDKKKIAFIKEISLIRAIIRKNMSQTTKNKKLKKSEFSERQKDK